MFVRFFFLLRLQTECEGNVCGNVTSGFSRTSTSTPVTAAARRGPGRPRGTGDGALGRTRAPTLLSRSWAAAGAQLSEVPAGLGMKEELGTHALLNDRGGGEAGPGCRRLRGATSPGRRGPDTWPRAPGRCRPPSPPPRLAGQDPEPQERGRDSSSKVTGTPWGQPSSFRLCGLIFATCCEKSLYRQWETFSRVLGSEAAFGRVPTPDVASVRFSTRDPSLRSLA